MSRTSNTTTTGTVGLSNAGSSSITDAQRELNAISSYTGKSINSTATVKPAWTDNSIGASGDTLFARIEALVDRFDAAVGHNHNGTDGNGPVLTIAELDLGAELEAIAVVNTTGLLTRTASGGSWTTRTATGTSNQITVTNGDGVSGNPTFAIASNPIIPGTGSLTLPTGTTGQRPGSPAAGMSRFNTTTGLQEVYTGSTWAGLAAATTVTFVGKNTAGSSIGTSYAKVPFTVVTDTNSGWSTDQYTIPSTGLYLVTWNLSTASVNLSTGQSFNTVFSVPGGSDLADGSVGTGTGVSTSKTSVGHYVGTINSGTVVALFAVSSVATTLSTSNSAANLSITRIG